MTKLNRAARGALLGCAAALASLAAPLFAQAQTVPPAPSVGAASFPSTADGRPISQLGVYPWRFWSWEEPFIDLTKMSGSRFIAKTFSGQIKSFSDMWAGGFIDKTTLLPTRIPAGYDYIQGGRIRDGAQTVPSGFSGTYVLEWTGNADMAFDLPKCGLKTNNCVRRISPNRVEATFSAQFKGIVDWKIFRIGAGGISSIRLYRKEHESLLKSGKILNPRFVNHARRYKILRFSDVQDASQARPFRAGDFVKYSQATWSPEWQFDGKTRDIPKQASFEAIFRTTMETGTAAWVHVAGLPGAPASFDGLVEPADASLWRAACRDNLQTILGSPDWAAYMDEIVLGLTAAGYPADRMLYLEPWNEVWNFAGPWARMSHCSDGVRDAIGIGAAPGWPLRYGYGYLAAHVMVEFNRALQRAGRAQAWTLVMGAQMDWDQVAVGSLEGFRRYFGDRGVNAAPWMRHVGISTASYYRGGLDRNTGFLKATSDAEHLSKLKASIAAGTASRALADWYVSGPSGALATIATLVVQRNQNQAAAQAYGAYFLGDYEGESHETLPHYLASDPVVVNWMESFIEGPEGERTTRAWAQAMRAQNPNAVIGNYYSIQPRDPEGSSASDTKFTDPWYDGYYGDDTGRTRGLTEILR